MKKIISFSLWCQDNPLDGYKYQTHNMYCNGAIQNLKIQKETNIFKDWKLRFYLNNTVPKDVQDKILKLGGEIIDMSDSKIPGMYWRFLPFNDDNVDIFIVRDTDSRINLRDYNAVKAWLDSDKIMHVMRDHPHHKYKILGGMWGFKNYMEKFNILKPLDFFLSKRNYHFTRMDDMKFLDYIYDIFHENNRVLEHDQFFKYKYSQPFPDNSFNNTYYSYVGEIHDEYNKKPYIKRDTKLFENFNKN